MGSVTPLILITGSNGLIGSKLKQIFSKSKLRILSPPRSELNLLNTKSILSYLNKNNPLIIINCAAYTNMEEAERQKGDKKGLAWQINVEGTKNIASACKKQNIFLIHISTDCVFYDFKNIKNGYNENLKPIQNRQKLSWYGYTKLIAEQELLKTKIKCAIVRISYPFGSAKSQKDFILKTREYINTNVPFFKDFYFTPTFIPDLAKAIERIIKLKKTGVYHVSTTNITTPHKIALYTAKILSLKNTIKNQKLTYYLKNNNTYIRPQNSSLNSKKTQKILRVKFHSWQKAIDNYAHEIN